MIGGGGNDLFIVDNTGDKAKDGLNQGIDSVRSSVSYTLLPNVENLTLTGTNTLNGTGNALANTITGNIAANVLTGAAGNDLIQGLGGNDILNGGAGADTMVGGAGNDTYIVDNLGDCVFETTTATSTTNAGGIDVVKASVSYTIGSFVEQLTLTGTNAINATGNALANKLLGNTAKNVLNGAAGNDTLNGNGGNDRLLGGAGNDTILGGAGADTLVGGAGRDVLTGGGGNDIFKFNTAGESGPASAIWDIVSDFVSGQDRIDLSSLDANTLLGGKQAFGQLLVSGEVFSQAGQLKFEDGVLYGNTDDDAAAEFAVALTGISTFAMTDLIA